METMVELIHRGARQTLEAQKVTVLGCPACGALPKIDWHFSGLVCIYCDQDDCQGLGDGWPQASAETYAEAAKKWNSTRGKT